MLDCDTDVVQLQEGHLASLGKLFRSVSWDSYTDIDRQLFLRWAGSYASGIKVKGELVACGMAVTFDHYLARLCCIITNPNFQGHGFASKITQVLFERLQSDGFTCIELDASVQGKPVYEKLGFQEIWNVNCYGINNQKTVISEQVNTRAFDTRHVEEVIALDSKAYGIDRSRFILSLVEQNPKGLFVDLSGDKVEGFAYVSIRNGFMDIGPWIHQNPEGARRLFDRVLAAHPNQKVGVYALEPNVKVEEILRSYDFSKEMTLTRMFRGERRVAVEDPSIYYGLMSPVSG